MKPISFSCEDTLSISAEEIVQQILDLENWTDFQGFAFLPGIRAAEFESRTPEVVGTRIRVKNTDGSTHVEEIVEWHPGRRLTLHFRNFSPPVSRLATRFEETWDFEPIRGGTKVVRSFRLFAKSFLTWPLLWLISILLKKAIARHLAQMRMGRESQVHR
jgi:hypothetical protein